ncbi:MAG: diguanylate cyclase [Gammaproteobacteria bacterium]|nr:diguanylate cyclase [Gammaproteobacteria bacterium]
MSKLLIIEDSFLIQKVIKHLASVELNCEFDFASTMAETIELIAKNDYFLVLADLNLPDAPHGEVVDVVLSAGISTIVLTATMNDERREQMLTMGVLDYIYKENRDSYTTAVRLANQLLLNREIKVIVADDSKTLRNYISAQLRKLLYDVIEVENGIEALKALAKYPEVGLLITDYNMPKMNGMELIRAIRQTRTRDEFPIIGLSSSSDATLSARFIKYGANDFLMTPFIQEEFQWRILKAMEQISLIKKIKEAANRDYLTKLYNRRYFFNVAEKLFRSAKIDDTELTVALIDIDYFKKINDTYGHDSGDAVLVELSNLLNKTFNKYTVARYGGEEFIIIIEGVSRVFCAQYFERFRDAVARTKFTIPDGVITVTISIGVGNSLKSDLLEMISDADTALYKAKQMGRNMVAWS